MCLWQGNLVEKGYALTLAHEDGVYQVPKHNNPVLNFLYLYNPEKNLQPLVCNF